jgi:hypothetical protein
MKPEHMSGVNRGVGNPAKGPAGSSALKAVAVQNFAVLTMNLQPMVNKCYREGIQVDIAHANIRAGASETAVSCSGLCNL